MIPKDQWKWFGYPLHYCLGYLCTFHLATQVGKYLISTIGMQQDSKHLGSPEKSDYINYTLDGRKAYFETAVFLWKPRHDCLCPDIDFAIYDYEEVDRHVYGDIFACDLANATHLAFCERYALL